jgi:2-oxoglutarate ferredoxin oxidoreductase subunit beta
MVNIDDFNSDFENKWCPGCGNFFILEAMKAAFSSLCLLPEHILLVSGIGQAGKTPHFLKCNVFHGLHGRALPLATGAKAANHDLSIIVNSGDGDCYGEGGNHFINAIRRNIDITLLVHNNQVYGLTQGQASPTSGKGMVTKVQPHGVILEPFNPIAVSLALGAGFVARGFAGNKDQLSLLIQEGIKHEGFAIIDILQPCVSFNKTNTFGWYKKRVYDLTKTDHVSDDFDSAIKLSRQWDEKIPTGIFYQEVKPSYTQMIEALNQGPLIQRQYNSNRVEELISEL